MKVADGAVLYRISSENSDEDIWLHSLSTGEPGLGSPDNPTYLVGNTILEDGDGNCSYHKTYILLDKVTYIAPAIACGDE